MIIIHNYKKRIINNYYYDNEKENEYATRNNKNAI